ncbi:MAG: preprotein translocase subunit YajC [Chlorobi bacterium]|nr:preprotein translocase subunit YajC [Chlorobiota bacterium]
MDLYSIFLFAPPPGDGGGVSSIAPTLIMFGAIGLIFYFMIIRPQSKRMKAHRQLVANVKRGDRVTMNGGLHGTVHEVKETTVLVEIARNTIAEFEKGSIQSVKQGSDS